MAYSDVNSALVYGIPTALFIGNTSLDKKYKVFHLFNTFLISSTLAQSFKNKNKCNPPDLDNTGIKGSFEFVIISTYFFDE